MRDLPYSISAAAFRSSSGEYAWRRSEIEVALLAIRDTGQAVLGGEVWRIAGSNQWNGLIPDRGGGADGIWHWETAPRTASESWSKYCDRTAHESIDAVRRMAVEDATLQGLVDSLRFNVSFIDETEA